MSGSEHRAHCHACGGRLPAKAHPNRKYCGTCAPIAHLYGPGAVEERRSRLALFGVTSKEAELAVMSTGVTIGACRACSAPILWAQEGNRWVPLAVKPIRARKGGGYVLQPSDGPARAVWLDYPKLCTPAIPYVWRRHGCDEYERLRAQGAAPTFNRQAEGCDATGT